MMYSATLLASLLASAHGFASIPEAGSGEAPEVECSANEEKFFVYSIDPSLGYKFVQDLDADKYTDPAVDYSLVGNTWMGVELTITQNVTGGAVLRPKTVTSPNAYSVDASGTFTGIAVVSEDFCLPHGSYVVKTTAPTHPAMTDYLTKRNELITYQPILDFAVQFFGDRSPFYNFNPWVAKWAIFPSTMRATAMTVAATGPALGLEFIANNTDKVFAGCEVSYEKVKVVPAPEDKAPFYLGMGGAPFTDAYVCF